MRTDMEREMVVTRSTVVNALLPRNSAGTAGERAKSRRCRFVRLRWTRVDPNTRA